MKIRFSKLVLLPLAALALLTWAGAAGADQWSIVGSRYQAMGGAGVAFANDGLAGYWNPANLGFEKGWDAQLPITFNANIENRAAEQLSNLIQKADNAASIIDQAETSSGGLTEQEATALADVLASFVTLGQDGQSVHFGVDVGLAGHYKNYGFSVLSISTGTVYPNVDLQNLGLFADTVGPGSQVARIGALVDNVLGATASNQALAALVTLRSGGAWDSPAANGLVYLFEQAGANTNDSRTQSLIVGLANATASNNASLAQNQTGALTAGLSTQEAAFTYAHTLPVPFLDRTSGLVRSILEPLHNNVSIGGNVKYMMGVTFVNRTSYASGNSAGDALADMGSFKNTKISHNFGLDLALAVRPYDWISFGMVARNVNSPSFDANVVGSIEIEPQVRMGVAARPLDNLLLAFDFDATKNTVPTIPGFESRLVSMGAEYTIPLGDMFGIALRLGGYDNVAGVGSHWAMTGGLGLKIGGFVLDLSAGGAFAKETVRTGSTSTIELPRRLNAGLTLKWEKTI